MADELTFSNAFSAPNNYLILIHFLSLLVQRIMMTFLDITPHLSGINSTCLCCTFWHFIHLTLMGALLWQPHCLLGALTSGIWLPRVQPDPVAPPSEASVWLTCSPHALHRSPRQSPLQCSREPFLKAPLLCIFPPSPPRGKLTKDRSKLCFIC